VRRGGAVAGRIDGLDVYRTDPARPHDRRARPAHRIYLVGARPRASEEVSRCEALAGLERQEIVKIGPSDIKKSSRQPL